MVSRFGAAGVRYSHELPHTSCMALVIENFMEWALHKFLSGCARYTIRSTSTTVNLHPWVGVILIVDSRALILQHLWDQDATRRAWASLVGDVSRWHLGRQNRCVVAVDAREKHLFLDHRCSIK